MTKRSRRQLRLAQPFLTVRFWIPVRASKSLSFWHTPNFLFLKNFLNSILKKIFIEYSCTTHSITMLFSAVQQNECQPYIYTDPSFWISFLFQVTTVFESSPRFWFVIYSIHSSVYIINPSLPIHPTLLPPWYPYVCSLYLCLCFGFANEVMYTILVDSTYKGYDVLFSLSWLSSLCGTVSRLTRVSKNDPICSFFWLNNILLYVPHLPYPFLHWWVIRLLPWCTCLFTGSK